MNPVLAHLAPVLAHLGGAPEALTIALPVLIFSGFMLLERRARRRERDAAQRHDGPQQDEGRAPDVPTS